MCFEGDVNSGKRVYSLWFMVYSFSLLRLVLSN